MSKDDIDIDDLIDQLNRCDLNKQDGPKIPIYSIYLIVGIILCCTIFGAIIGIPMIIVALQNIGKEI